MANSRPPAVLCGTCKNLFPVAKAYGPLPRYCSETCHPSRRHAPAAQKRTGRTSATKAIRAGRTPELRPQGGQTGGHNGHVTVTSETEYTDAEVEFAMAVDRYKRERKRPFPALSEFLAIAVSLGYRRVEPAGPLPGTRGNE